MKCAGCGSASAQGVQRYGNRWCASCAAGIEFEERLAASNGMAVREVFISDRGEVSFLLDSANGEPLSDASYQGIALSEGDVLRELVDAIRAVKQECILVGDRVAFITKGAEAPARRYLELAAKYEPLLRCEERREAAEMARIARMIVDGIAANAN